MDRIRSISRVMRLACVFFAAAIPIALAIYWLAPGASPPVGGTHAAALTDNLTMVKRLAGLALYLVPTGFAALALVRLAGVFAGYAQGHIFTQAAVDGLRGVAWAAVWATAARIVVTPIATVALTVDNPPGERMVAIEVSSNDVFAALFALTLLVIAWVMSEARRIADDLNQII